jgi:hypothetical protein
MYVTVKENFVMDLDGNGKFDIFIKNKLRL